MIEHVPAVNTVLDVNDELSLTPEDRVLALSALNFDLSVYDMFGPLSVGGAVVLPAPADQREPGNWLAVTADARSRCRSPPRKSCCSPSGARSSTRPRCPFWTTSSSWAAIRCRPCA
jgi:hypothetical protein